MPPIICQKLSFEHIYNTLGAQSDIMLEEAAHFTESREAFKERMLDKLRQICHQLFFDPFELVVWMHLIDQHEFDIMNVRQQTIQYQDGEGSMEGIKLEQIMVFLGLAVK